MKRKLNSPSKSLSSFSDEALITQMRSESDNRFAGELFKRYAHLVYHICSNYIKDRGECEDIVMNVFEKLLKKPPLDNVYSFKKWLLTVAKHESLTFLRNKARAKGMAEQWGKNEKKSEYFVENEATWSLSYKEDAEIAVQKAMTQLKGPQKICLELFFVEGMSYKEIEAKTEFSLKEIKSHLQNGKRKLKLLLQEEYG